MTVSCIAGYLSLNAITKGVCLMSTETEVWRKTILLPESLETGKVEEIAGEVKERVRGLIVRVSTTHRSENNGKPGIRISGSIMEHIDNAVLIAYRSTVRHLGENRELPVLTHIGVQRC